MMFRKKLTLLFFVIAIIALVALLLRHIIPLIAGPLLTVESPTQGASYAESLIYVSGTTKRVVRMTLNGQAILVREDGIYDIPLVLIDGINTLSLDAEDKFGHTSNTEIVVFKTR